jgi:apolipoprotein N-acyltransferase
VCPSHSLQKRIRKLAPALAAGLLLRLSMPGVSLFPLAFVALIPLILSIDEKNRRFVFVQGFWMAVAYWASLIFWMNQVVTPGYFALVIYLSLFSGLFCIGYTSRKPGMGRALFGALLWTALEYVRSIGGWSFAWGLVGHCLGIVPPLAQSARWWGVYGLSFVIVWINFSLAEWWLGRKTKKTPGWFMPALPLLLFGMSIFWTNLKSPAPEIENRQFRVALIQGSFPQEKKWTVKLEDVVDRYLDLSEKALNGKPDLVIWPETAVPAILTRSSKLEKPIRDWIQQNQLPLLLGSVAHHPISRDLFNSAFLLEPGGPVLAEVDRYDKRHLVPFGEYIPFKQLLPFVEKMVESRGGGEYLFGAPAGKIFEVEGYRFGVLICFESTLTPMGVEYARQGADFLVVITNDAWFGQTSAAWQHGVQSIFRAIETGLPVVRAANTGWTCAFDSRGRLLADIPVYKPGWMAVDLPEKTTPTLYSRWGDGPTVLMILVLLLWLGAEWVGVKKRT